MNYLRVTPNNITSLKPNEVFVFGSNLSGRHGKGAAKTALRWGAKYGNCCGLQGNTYAIPTMDRQIKKHLVLCSIKYHIDKFVEFAKMNPDLIFFVTPIGCGLAGYKPKDIAPLFKDAVNVGNIYLPESFWIILLK